MKHEVIVGPEAMDGFMNSAINQVIVWEEDVKDAIEVIAVTDGVRMIMCEPNEVIHCYFEEQKVTIEEEGEFVPYLWSDREVVNIAMLQGFQNGEMLKESLNKFGKFLVIRWQAMKW